MVYCTLMVVFTIFTVPPIDMILPLRTLWSVTPVVETEIMETTNEALKDGLIYDEDLVNGGK